MCAAQRKRRATRAFLRKSTSFSGSSITGLTQVFWPLDNRLDPCETKQKVDLACVNGKRTTQASSDPEGPLCGFNSGKAQGGMLDQIDNASFIIYLQPQGIGAISCELFYLNMGSLEL